VVYNIFAMNQTMKKQLTTEQGMYIIATLLALTLRLLNLGAIPLSEFEADWALQARGLVEGQPVNIGSQPLIVMLMSAVFTLFGTSEFAVRLFPALFGTALVWLPYFFRALFLPVEVGTQGSFGIGIRFGIGPWSVVSLPAWRRTGVSTEHRSLMFDRLDLWLSYIGGRVGCVSIAFKSCHSTWRARIGSCLGIDRGLRKRRQTSLPPRRCETGCTGWVCNFAVGRDFFYALPPGYIRIGKRFHRLPGRLGEQLGCAGFSLVCSVVGR
jgi:hypothetical protein